MTGPEFKAACRRLRLTGSCNKHLSGSDAARLFRVSSGRVIRSWQSGEAQVPGLVNEVMRGLERSQHLRDWFGVERVDD